MKREITVSLVLGLLVSIVFINFVSAAITIPIKEIAEPLSKDRKCTLNHDISWLGDAYASCTKGAQVSITSYGPCCIANTALNIVLWFFYGVILFALVFMFIGSYQILTAGGNSDKVTLGRKYIMWAVVGLILALFAFILPRIVLTLVF